MKDNIPGVRNGDGGNKPCPIEAARGPAALCHGALFLERHNAEVNLGGTCFNQLLACKV